MPTPCCHIAASWEALQNEFACTRSVFEHALDVDPWSVPLWLTHTEAELKSRNVQHLRNIFNYVQRVSVPCFVSFFSCSDLSLPMLSPACGCPRLIGFFLCPDLFPSGMVSSQWVLLAWSVSFCMLTYTDAVSRDRVPLAWSASFCVLIYLSRCHSLWYVLRFLFSFSIFGCGLPTSF